jgi:hypothetical protein
MTSLPEPLVPAYVDLRDLDGFMLNAERLLASELWALTRRSPEALRGAVALWCRSWKQMPAASLPNDDAVLAVFADMPMPRFKKLRPLVMRGFVLCADDRFYHKVLAAEAVNAWARKQAYRKRREADRKRLDDWRRHKRGRADAPPNETALETPEETADETRFVAEGTGTGTLSVSKDTAPGAHSAVKDLFDIGVRLLAGPGRSEASARKLIGKARQDLGDERLAAILAQAANMTDSAAYLMAAINKTKFRVVHGPGYAPMPSAAGG